MIVRNATPADMPQVMDLCREAAAESFYSHLPFHDNAVRKVMAYHIGAPTAFAQVAEKDGELVGLLVGGYERIWHSTMRRASDLVFYVSPEGKGAGSILARRFVRWARSQKNMGLIGISVSFGGPSVKRTGKMLERMGMTYTGGIYLEKCDE